MTEGVEKRKVLLGVTGSIAAYKAAEITRILILRGYSVRVVMTSAACEFISPMTLETLSGNPVVTGFWDGSESSAVTHIELAEWADLLLIAPASADTIAKLANGQCDNPLLGAALVTRSPILLAPAMNTRMFEHEATQKNLEILKERGVSIIPTEEGELACGWVGSGRLAEPWEVFYNVRKCLSISDYAGKRVIVTTGPTRERIDPVRFVTNRSSGKMGVALARELYRRGADVTIIHGPVRVAVPKTIECILVESAESMREEVLARTFDVERPADIVIMAAAVADYRPREVLNHKLKKTDESISIDLVRNPDILEELGVRKGSNDRPVLAGFAMETGELDDLITEARAKLKRKNADLIVGNFASEALELDTNRAWLVDRHGRQDEVATTYKSRVANRILDAILKL